MQNADTAKRHAERDDDQYFRTDMNVSVVRRMEIENRLRHAHRQGQVLMYYQPKIDLT